MNRLTRNETAAFLRERDDYLILTHRRPDGDTIGCAVALCLALRSMGKRADIYPNPQFTPKFAPLLEGLTAPEGVEPQTVVAVDVASRRLFPFGMEQAAVDLAIDHHGSNDCFSDSLLVEPDKAACGEILLDLIGLLGEKLTRTMAEALYVAISTDTGCFRYANVTANTFRCAAACVEAGAILPPINRQFFEVRRVPRLKLEGWLTEHLEFYAGGLVAISAIPDALLKELGLTEDDIDDISGFGRTVEGVEIGVMLREAEGGMGKASVRTSPRFDASRICRRFGGGGHAGAAGGTVPGGLPAIRKAVLDAISEEVKL